MIYNFDDLSFQIMEINNYYHKDGYYDIMGRPYSALTFRVSGSVDFEIGNNHFTSTPGSVIFIPKNASYKAKYTNGESIVIHFLKCNYKNAEVIEPMQNEIMYKEFNDLLSEWRKTHSVNRAKSSIYNILDLIFKTKIHSIEDTVFNECISFIRENFTDPTINISDICSRNHISESTINRKFKTYYNLSPKQYILKLRLDKAIKLLTDGKYSVKHISDECGFCDEKYFSRSIKKKLGHPPSYFKKKISI